MRCSGGVIVLCAGVEVAESIGQCKLRQGIHARRHHGRCRGRAGLPVSR
jgi:hypothetical protein